MLKNFVLFLILMFITQFSSMFLITSVIYVIKGEYVMENEERIEKFLLLSERNRREILSALPQERQISKLADYFQNFSDSTRIKILTCLSMMNMCVNDLSTILGINQTTISHQLKQLKDQNLVAYRREGKILVYYLTNESVNDMMMYALDSHVI